MNKEMLLLLQKNIESEKENTDRLFEIKLGELRKYQQETISRVEKVKTEYFPEEIDRMFRKVIMEKFGKDDYGWYSLWVNGEKIELFYSNNASEGFKVLRYDGQRFEKGKLHCDIPNWWKEECYRESHMNSYKLKLDMLNKLLDLLVNNIEEVYTYIANAIQNMENKKREKNNFVLQSMNSLENKEENKERRKVKIIIEIEDTL